ncbi:MAG: hypothetical protein WBE14_09810, partial [Xanthobacteraceae bacterium]
KLEGAFVAWASRKQRHKLRALSGGSQGSDISVGVEGCSVPRYFFKIQRSDGEFEGDPHGTNLPDLRRRFLMRRGRSMRCDLKVDLMIRV